MAHRLGRPAQGPGRVHSHTVQLAEDAATIAERLAELDWDHLDRHPPDLPPAKVYSTFGRLVDAAIYRLADQRPGLRFARLEAGHVALGFDSEATPDLAWLLLDHRWKKVREHPGDAAYYRAAMTVARVRAAHLAQWRERSNRVPEILYEAALPRLGDLEWDGVLMRVGTRLHLFARERRLSEALKHEGLAGVRALGGHLVGEVAGALGFDRGATIPPQVMLGGRWFVRTFQALMRVQPHPLVVGVERGDVNPSAVAGLWNDRSAGLLLYRDEWRAEGAGEEPPPGTSRAFTPVAMNLPAPTPQREPALGVLLDSGDAGVARSTTPTEALTEIRTYAARLQETARVFGAGDVPSVLLALTAEANDAAQALDAAEEKLRVVYETLARLGRVMALPRDEAPAAVIERWCRHEFPLLDLAADSGNANSTDTAQASNAESLARQAREGWAAVCARRPHAEAARRWAVAICVALHDQGHEPRPDPRNPGLGVCPRCGGREPLVALPTGATPATDELAAAPKSRRHSPSAFLLD